ncbi:hypothetical protein NFI96_015768 [Prochilodus magdalenae]|nr:hypothetical protein NFI96_015768 [Prochilodus magdalenae]
MLGEKPGTSAPDPRSLSGWIGSSRAAVLALCVFVAALCACAAFLLYRAVRGRLEGDTKDAAGDQDDRAAESTDVSDEGGSEECDTDSSEAAILSSINNTKIGFPKENLGDTTLATLYEPTEGLPAGLIPAIGETGTQCSEDYNGQDKLEGGAAESVKVEADLFDYQYEGSKQVVDSLKETKCDVEEFETELHGDVDEPSETESAQETLDVKSVAVPHCQSVEDLLDNTLLAQDVVSMPSKTELESVLHFSSDTTEAGDNTTKMNDEEASKKGFENSIDRCCPKANELDCRSYDEQSDLLSCNSAVDKASGIGNQVKGEQDFDGSSVVVNTVENSGYGHSNIKYVLDHPQQNFLGFTTPSLQGDSTGQVQLPDVSRERSVVTVGSSVTVPVEASHDKNEINIMEAIMDSNEWLGTGPPDTRDLPWLTQTQSHGFKTNTSLVTPATSHTTDQPKQAPSKTSHGLVTEESRPHKEKTEGSAVAPEDTVIGVADDEEDFLNKKVAAVSPMPQMVRVSFRVHYITHSLSQLLAVTGNQQELGAWESFVPLQRVEDWFWANTITLPAENQVEWKFVLVEDGKIRRWEECGNRHLVVTGQEEEIRLDKSWGYM